MVVPSKLVRNLNSLDLCNPVSDWVLKFLTNRSQTVKTESTNNHTDSENGTSTGCCLSPVLYTLLTHNCVAKYNGNQTIKAWRMETSN